MRNRTYGGVRGRKTKVGEKLLRFPPTRLKVGIVPSVFSDDCLICYLIIFITSSMLRLNGPLCSSLMVHMAAANFPASTGLAPCRRL